MRHSYTNHWIKRLRVVWRCQAGDIGSKAEKELQDQQGKSDGRWSRQKLFALVATKNDKRSTTQHDNDSKRSTDVGQHEVCWQRPIPGG
jgi:hypothetical protein